MGCLECVGACVCEAMCVGGPACVGPCVCGALCVWGPVCVEALSVGALCVGPCVWGPVCGVLCGEGPFMPCMSVRVPDGLLIIARPLFSSPDN